MESDLLNWLQEWFSSNCDGYFEHNSGVKINTVDNPGWSIKIDLNDSNLELDDLDWVEIERTELDWYMYQIKDNVFHGVGDSNKLVLLISKFKEIVEKNTT